MKANELRIGNLLNYDTAEGEILPTVIDWQDLRWLTEDPKSFNLVHSPIPLTEEWLLKFGFRKGHLFDTVLYLSGTNWHLSFHDGIYQLNYKVSQSAPWVPVCKDLKHVHQIQNLYFALTGEELTFEL